MQNELISQVPGLQDLVDWFGYLPSFHDHEVVDIFLDRKNLSKIRIHSWHTTNKIIKNRHRTEKDVLVTLCFKNIFELELADFNHQNVLSSLDIRKVDNRFIIELIGIYGLSGLIEAEELTISFEERTDF